MAQATPVEQPAGRRGRVMVTGGAGFVGVNLLRYLAARDFLLTSLDLAEFTYPDLRERVRVVQGDIRDRAAVERATEGAEFVVHCAAALPLYSRQDIYTTDVEGTRTVLDVALAHHIQRVVHI